MSRLDRAAAGAIAGLILAIGLVSGFGLRARGLAPGHYLLYLAPASGRVRDLYTLTEAGGTARRLVEDAAEYAPEPGGAHIAYIQAGALWVLDTATGERERIAACPVRCADPTWRPGDSLIAYSALDEQGRGRLWLADADGGDNRPLLADAAIGGRGAQWSGDGARIAFYDQGAGSESGSGAVVVYDLTRPRGAALARFPDAMPPYALSPDGETLLFRGERSLQSASAMGGKARTFAALAGISGLIWQPGNTQLAVIAGDVGSAVSALVLNADGDTLSVVGDPAYSVRALAWSGDSMAVERVAWSGDARANLNALPGIWMLDNNDGWTPWVQNATAPAWLEWR